MPVLDKIHAQLPPWASAHLEAALTTSTTHLGKYGLYYVGAWVAVVLYHVYRWTLQSRFFSPLRKMPGPKYGHWFMGQAVPLVEEEAAMLQMKWHREFGPRIRFIIPFGTEVVSFTEYSALKQILVERPYDYPKPPWVRNLLGLTAGFGLLTLEDRHHADMRRFMNNAFAFKYIEQQFEAYNRHIGGLLDLLKKEVGPNGKVVEMTHSVNACLLDIICSTAFGYETDHLHNPEETLGHSYETLVNMQNGGNMAMLMTFLALPGGTTLIGWLSTRKWTGDLLQSLSSVFKRLGLDPIMYPTAQLCTHMYRIHQVSQHMLDTKLEEARQLKKAGDSENGGKIDVLSLLVKASMDESSPYRMGPASIRAQVLTFLGAGHETTASGMAWALWELARDQRVQKKLRVECQELLMRVENPEYQDIKHLKYLDAVVNEIMRIRPPTPHTARQAKVDSTIDGVFVPKGTVIYIPNRIVNTDPDLWGEDALDFRPERWETLPEKYNSTFSVLTFIAGAHHCIGERMARNELKALLCALVANFEFHLKSPDQTVKAAAAITMKPDGGLELMVVPTKMGQA